MSKFSTLSSQWKSGSIHPLICVFLGAILWSSLKVCSVHSAHQSRIFSNEGVLILEAAEDKNITFRVSGSSKFLINDVNVLDSIKKREGPEFGSQNAEVASIPNQIQSLRMGVYRLANRLRLFENRTLTPLPRGRIRRVQARIRTLVGRVNVIEKKLLEDDCGSNPCKNGGTCFDLYDGFHCECPSTWTGNTCERDVNECDILTGTDLGCQNNGVCVNLPGSYRCVCSNGFTGSHCRSRGKSCTDSAGGDICGNGVCVPANNEMGYKCLCNTGWKIDNVTQSCLVDVDECRESLVGCHISCINLPGSFMCGPCPTGYTGNGLVCQDINECEVDNGGCSVNPQVRCINTEGSYHCGNCPPGWTGDGRYCTQTESNACGLNSICHPLAKCEYISNVMVCECPEGMSGSGYGPGGCRSGSADPCNQHRCQNGGTCVSHGTTYTCICPPDFNLPFCELHNPCASSPCLNGGTCITIDNSRNFRCICSKDASGRFCQIKRTTCGSVIRERSGELVYPPEGGEYFDNIACAWIIYTDESLALNITFSRFDIQQDPDCNKDWLQLNDGKTLATPLIGRFCGKSLPRGGTVLSSQNALFLWFRSDNNTNGLGFSLSWTSVAPTCGGRYEVGIMEHGVIKSPGYPGKSPPNRDCEWIIVAPVGKRVLFRFFEVVMDPSNNCTKDSLLIYDTNEVLESICQTGIPQPIYSSTNIAKLHFHTDSVEEASLFQAHYEIVEGKPGCGGLLSEPKGKILLTADMTNCVFLIQQPTGMRVFVTFTKTDIVFGVSTIKIYDGKTVDSPLLLESRDDMTPGNVTSSENLMLLSISVKTTFAVSIKVIVYEVSYAQVCGQELRNLEGGSFTTPNYPLPYYSGLDCVYVIVGPVDSVVHLNITDYDLSASGSACDSYSDFVEIFYSTGGPGVRHCKDGPMHIVAPSNYLRVYFHSNDNTQQRRGIAVAYRFEAMGCGGVLQDSEGSFQLLDPVSVTSTYCEWVLEAPETHEISLDLTYVRVGTRCSQGETDLQIFLNSTYTGDRLVESHCGGEKRIVSILPSKMATVFLRLVPPSVGRTVSYGIAANYTFIPRTTKCGGNYSLLAGSIQSPGWPSEYYDSLDCIWVIHAPLGHKIELIPRNFSLEFNSKRCDDDYLEIRNGMSNVSPLIGRYCGTSIPPRIPSFTNHLYLHFRTDASFNFPGFNIEFQQTSTGCGGNLNSYRGSIASPHYPEISPGPVQCDWKITVNQGSAIDLRITMFSPSDEVLVLYDGGDSLAKQIPLPSQSLDTPIEVKSTGNVVLVRYILPDIDATKDQQFYLEYKTDCQQTLDIPMGVIESPNFPNDYPNLLKCEWRIKGTRTDTISITISHFALEQFDHDCKYDVFELIDMKGDEILKTQKICRELNEVVTSDGNQLVVKFKTDFSGGGKGFRLEFKRNGCGGHLTRASGIIASPRYPYSVDVECEWWLENVPGKQFVLDVFDMAIEGDNHNCENNGLIVKNDKDDSTELVKWCRSQQSPLTVTSKGNSMFVRFYTDATRSRKYLRASFRTRSAQCGGIFGGNTGFIASPNFPEKYPANTFCEWIINVDNNFVLLFNFTGFNLPEAVNCSMGYIEVYDGLKSDSNMKFVGRYCGKQAPDLFKQEWRNKIHIIFSSGNGPSYPGFGMHYIASCGRSIMETSGYIKSRAQDHLCVWQINGKDEGTKIVINVLHIDCDCEGLNESDCNEQRGVKVYTITGETIAQFCHSHPAPITASTSGLLIRAANVTFSAKFSTLESACGGLLTSLRGILTSPYYPETYPLNSECVWTIQALSGNYLEMNFLEIDIPSSENCNQDYLEIREKASNGKLLGVFCSSSLPTESTRAYERAWIKFRSGENGVGKGFKLSWSHAQINEISGFKGKIQPPPLMSLRSIQEPFQWRIAVPRDNVVQLSFIEYNSGLKLFDGFDSEALPIDIQQSPWQTISSTNVILLMSDNQILDNFLIEWKALLRTTASKDEVHKDCNETLILTSGPPVNLSSPGYPTGYASNLRCQWLVMADSPARHAVVELYEVHLEKLPTCMADSLTVYSSNNLMNWHEEVKICDSPPLIKNPVAEIHGTPNLRLNMKTDATVNSTGFTSLVYTLCGGNMTGPIGRILNADVHNHSSNILAHNCNWHIAVSPGRVIQFTFEFPPNTAKNSSDECEMYAIIRDGIDEGAAILSPGRICSNKKFNGTVLSTGNYATVKYFLLPQNPFLSYTLNIWNLTYREYSNCGGEVSLTQYASTVNITSPNYPSVPDPHTECIWLVVAPPGEALLVEFVGKFDLNILYCDQEYVEIRDGSTQFSRLLGKHCTRPATIRSSGNVIYLRYFTDIAEPRNGFKALVSLSNCGGTFTQYSNTITSSNYPALGGYPSNSVCDYAIKAGWNYRNMLSFTDIHLPFNSTDIDGSDHIKIYQIYHTDSGPVEEEVATFYGNITNLPNLEIDSNELVIRFYTFKANHEFRGFMAKYERSFGLCYKDVSGDSGVLSLNLRPYRRPMAAMCRWKITVPKGKRVKLDLTDSVTAVRIANISTNFKVTFFNDFSMLSPITVLDLTNITSATTVSSSDNKMFIRIFRIHSGNLRKFQMSYSSLEDTQCPGDLTADSGTMSVANLDQDTNFFCNSEFTLNGIETIVFDISKVVVETKNPSLPSFAVRFRSEPQVESLQLLRNNATNIRVVMANKRGSVSMLQNGNIRLLNFEASYRKHACGGAYPLGQKFVISTPNFTDTYGSLDCVWQLTGGGYAHGFLLTGNFTFSQSCDEEYFSVHSGPSSGHLQIARICRGFTLNTTAIRSTYIYVFYHSANFNTNSNFQMVFERAINCGGNLQVKSNTLLQFTAKDYKNNLECVWDFTTTPSFFLRLEFLGRFYIEDSVNCTKDYLEIRIYETGIWRAFPRYCGRNIPTAINTTSSRLQVIFRSDAATTADGFSLNVAKTCYAVFNVTSRPQIIEYPARWSISRVKLSCTYILQTNSENLIHVKFKQLKFGRSANCLLAKLTIKKQTSWGTEVALGPYCKDNSATEVRSYKKLSISYEAIFEGGNYIIEYVLNECGGQVTQPMWITSLPNEEGTGYMNDMNCVWNITAPPGHNIVIQFKYLIMEERDECTLDYVAVYSGPLMTSDRLEAQLCKSTPNSPPVFHIEGNTAVLTAVSDSSVAHEGFAARVIFAKPCDERISLSEANSPVELTRDLMANETGNLFCNYKIMGVPGYRIQLEFKHIEINMQNVTCGTNCEHCNYIEVLDSVKNGGLTLGRYCSHNITLRKVSSMFKDITIRTSVEQVGTYTFSATLRLVENDCGPQNHFVLEENNPIQISSRRHQDGLYSSNIHCQWEVASKSAFDIRFDKFSLQNKSDTSGKCLDYVLIRFTGSWYQNVSQMHCGTISTYVVPVELHENVAFSTITFHTDEAVESEGFTLTIFNSPSCNRTYNSTSGSIRPLKETEVLCVNDIVVPENYTVNIVLGTIYFGSRNCSENNLKVYDKINNQEVYNYCNESTNRRSSLAIFTTSRAVRMEIHFYHGYLDRVLYYSSPKTLIPGCGGDLSIIAGCLMSPNYLAFGNATVCRWNLNTAAPGQITFHLRDLNMGSNCRENYVKVIDFTDNGDEKVVQHYCEQDKPSQFVSTSNHLSILSVTGNNFDGTGWTADFNRKLLPP